jgi:hypothetical protein
MYAIPNDRVTIKNQPATYAVVAWTPSHTVLRARDGSEHTVPTSDLHPAPMIKDHSFLQSLNGVRLEYVEGDSVIVSYGDFVSRAIFSHYVPIFESPAHHDRVVVLVDGSPVETNLGCVFYDPNPLRTFQAVDIKIRYDLEDAILKMDFSAFDWNGHHKNGAYWRDAQWFRPLNERNKELSAVRLYGDNPPSNDQATRLLAALGAGTALDEWVPIGTLRAYQYARCPFCGDASLDAKVETNGRDVRLMGTACPNPEGNVTNTFNINVASGKLVIANDLRDLAPVDDEVFDTNLMYGRFQVTRAYAEAGMAHGFVGNTCPSVYKMRGNQYRIGGKRTGATRVAGVCTDLWWYSIMDYDLYVARCAALGVTNTDISVIDVTPGVYEFTHFNDVDHNRDMNCIYATFRRVGKPLPAGPDTFLEAYSRQDCTAQQVLAQAIKNWPTLYLRDNDAKSVESIRCAANQFMCVNGGGVEWHENGHPIYNIDPDLEPLPAIPVFTGMHQWYPMSPGYCGIFNAAGMFSPSPYGPGTQEGVYGGHLNESFQELAYRVLQNIIVYGQRPHYSGSHPNQERDGKVERERCRQIMADCVTAFRRLSLRYPDTFPAVDPAFTGWMANTDEVTEWVNTVPLDPPCDVPEKVATYLAEDRRVRAGQAREALGLLSRNTSDMGR